MVKDKLHCKSSIELVSSSLPAIASLNDDRDEIMNYIKKDMTPFLPPSTKAMTMKKVKLVNMSSIYGIGPGSPTGFDYVSSPAPVPKMAIVPF